MSKDNMQAFKDIEIIKALNLNEADGRTKIWEIILRLLPDGCQYKLNNAVIGDVAYDIAKQLQDLSLDEVRLSQVCANCGSIGSCLFSEK